MKIAKSTVEKLVITDVPNLDPVAVIVEDHGRGAGKITITCWGKAWTHYWSHMGEGRTLADFFCKCDNAYLAGKLENGIKDEVDDDNEDALATLLRRELIEQRKRTDITKQRARELWDRVSSADLLGDPTDRQDICYYVLGHEWWELTPKKPNHEYVWLCKIIDAVKAAFREV